MTYDRKGGRLISVGGDGFIRIWNTQSGDELSSYKIDSPATITTIPDSGEIALAYEGHITMWDPGSGTDSITARELLQMPWRCEGLCFSNDANNFAAFNHYRLSLFERDSNNAAELRQKWTGTADEITTLARMDRHEMIACGTYTGKIALFELSTGKKLTQFDATGGAVRFLKSSADGNHLISAHDDATVIFWDVECLKLNALNRVGIDPP